MQSSSSHRVSWTLSALLGIVGWLAIVPGIAGAAGYAQGPDYYYTKIFPYYMFNAITTTTGYPASAWTGVVKDASGTVPGGYMGAMAIMFKTRGSTPPAVCNQSKPHYNGSTVLWDTVDEHVGDTDGGHGERPTTKRPKPLSRWLLRA